MLAELDEAFTQVTVEVGGASIAWRLNEPTLELALRPWWWHRAPREAPWVGGGDA